MTEDTLPIGTRLDDFEITAVLGQGGFGVTYKALDRRLQRNVAVKEYLPREFALRDETATVRPRSQKDDEIFKWGLSRFIDEARALAKFKHPSIVAVIRYLEANGTAYLVMEYEEGKDLERWVKGRTDPIPEDVLVDRIVFPLLDGLAKIHEAGILHRDIKPENVFIRRDGSPLLIDFGSSRPHGQGQSSNLTSIVSAGYSPFEQYGVSQRQGPWSDLYAFGGTLYRVVVGKPPTDAIARQQGVVLPAASEVAAGRYSERLLHAIDLALAMDPAERPQSAAEFKALLPPAGAVSTDESAPTVVRRDVAKRKSNRTRVAAFVVVAVVVAAVGLTLGWPMLEGRFASPSTEPLHRDGATATPPATATGTEKPAEPDKPAAADTVAGAASDGGNTSEAAAGGAPGEVAEANAGAGSAGDAKEADDESAIVAGWNLSPEVEDYRTSQIAGALLAYTSNKEKFDECLATGCGQQASLMAKLSEALKGYEWSRSGFQGIIRLANPRRLDDEKCPFLIDVDETLSNGTSERRQQRSYCTRDGFDRAIEQAGRITDRAIVQSSS